MFPLFLFSSLFLTAVLPFAYGASNSTQIIETRYDGLQCSGAILGTTNYTVGQCFPLVYTNQFAAYYLVNHRNSTTNVLMSTDLYYGTYLDGNCTITGAGTRYEFMTYLAAGIQSSNGLGEVGCQLYPSNDGLGKATTLTLAYPENAPNPPSATYPAQFNDLVTDIINTDGYSVRNCVDPNPSDTQQWEQTSSWQTRGKTCQLYTNYQVPMYGVSYCDSYRFGYTSVYLNSSTCTVGIPVTTRMWTNNRGDCQGGTLYQRACQAPPGDLIPLILTQPGMVIKKYFSSDDSCNQANNNDHTLINDNDGVYSATNICFSAIGDQKLTQYQCVNDTLNGGQLSIIETKYSYNSATPCSPSTKISQYTFRPNECGTINSIYPNTTFTCTTYTPLPLPVPVSSSSTAGGGVRSSSTGRDSLSAGAILQPSYVSHPFCTFLFAILLVIPWTQLI